MPEALDRATLQRLISAIGDRLPGRWLLVGGAYAAIALRRERTTQDIDIIGMENDNAARLSLMQLAEEEGYPIETINSAVDYFIRKVDGWEDLLCEVYRGESSVVFGPNLTLFIILKVGRMSEQDFDDCLAAVEKAKETGEQIEWVRIEAVIANSNLGPEGTARQHRLLEHR